MKNTSRHVPAILILLLCPLLFLAACGGNNNNDAAPATLVMNTFVLPRAVLDLAYTATLQASGGTGTFSWSVSQGALPSGLSLAPTTGEITGTPTVIGAFTFTVTVSSGDQTAERQLTLNIDQDPPALSISTAGLPNGTTDTAYSTFLRAAGGTGDYTWSMSLGNLPDGLTLDADTGEISGTPTVIALFTFTITVVSGAQTVDKELTINVDSDPPLLEVATTALPSSTVNVPYAAIVQATGGTGLFNWTVSQGELPDGLTLNETSGTITGTPTVAGTFTFTVNVVSGEQNADQQLSILIGDAINPSVQLLSVASDGTPGNGGSGGAALSPDGRFVAFTSFADNLAPNDTNQVPDIFIRDRVCQVTAMISLTRLAVAISSLPDGLVDADYQTGLTAIGGPAPFTWSITAGALPPGLTLDASTGGIAGIPTTEGTFGFTVQATDSSATPQTASKDLSILIDPASPPEPGDLTITTDSLPDGVRNQPYSATLKAADGTDPLTWSVILSVLPDGLTLAEDTGVISGTPTVAGTFNVFFQVQDSSDPVQTALRGFTIRLLADGSQGSVASFNPAISARTATAAGDFLFVAYTTDAPNLVPGDENGVRDVFVSAIQVVDAPTCTLTPADTARVSIATDGTEGNGPSSLPAISANGRYVVYQSSASNLSEGDTNGRSDVFLSELDFTAGVLTLVRTRLVSTFLRLADLPADLISSTLIGNSGLTLTDGEHAGQRVEILTGTAAGQVRTITGNDATTFSIDPPWETLPQTGDLFRVFSRSSGDSTLAQISADGNLLSFSSVGSFGSDDLLAASEVFVQERTTGITTRANLDDADAVAIGLHLGLALNDTGNLVLFTSTSDDFVPNDTNLVRDLFLRDRGTAQTVRVNLANDGSEANGPIGDGRTFQSGALSASGRLIVYESTATNLVGGPDFNRVRDVFLLDRNTATTRRLSQGLDGVETLRASFGVTISLDGSTVVFSSDAPNLVVNDDNSANDLFLFTTGLTETVSFLTAGLTTARLGIAYEESLQTVGGGDSLYYAVSEGALPPGITLDSRTGRLTGVPVEAGRYRFSVIVMDANRPSQSDTQTLELIVREKR